MNLSNTVQKEKVNLIDFLRVLFAIGIVGIHTGLVEALPSPFGFIILKLWFRLGVPFFFVTSGFFLTKKLEKCGSKRERIDVAIGSCRKCVVPLIVFGSIGLLEKCVNNGINAGIIRILHDAIFYPLGAMWYVAALIVSTIVIAFLYDHKFVLGGYR